jgi:NAD(P)-dependent dehydrogenase (short-subunit alcohol dehydrogenase family)
MPRPVLLIAGGSRGIGAATARLAAEQGYDVAVNYNANANAAASVVSAVKHAGGKAIAIQGHMGLEQDIERVFDTAAHELGPITHFVHSSGIIGPYSRLDEASAETMREVLEVNTLGALLCLREALRRMSTKHGGKGGVVVMLSSMAANIGGAGECVWYAAAKGAVDSMVIGASHEVAKEGVRVNAVSPGFTRAVALEAGIASGALNKDLLTHPTAMNRLVEPVEVAQAIAWLLSPASSGVTGINLPVDAGFIAGTTWAAYGGLPEAPEE